MLLNYYTTVSLHILHSWRNIFSLCDVITMSAATKSLWRWMNKGMMSSRVTNIMNDKRKRKGKGRGFKLFTAAIKHCYTAVDDYSPTTSFLRPVTTSTSSPFLPWAPTRLSPCRISSVTLKTTSDCCEGVCSVRLSCVKAQPSGSLKLVMCEVWHACYCTPAVLWADMSRYASDWGR